MDEKELIKELQEKIKKSLLKLQEKYNSNIVNYEENGEEDFNKWLDIFKEKESNALIVGTGLFTYWEKCLDCKVFSLVDINGFCKDCYIEDIEKEMELNAFTPKKKRILSVKKELKADGYQEKRNLCIKNGNSKDGLASEKKLNNRSIK